MKDNKLSMRNILLLIHFLATNSIFIVCVSKNIGETRTIKIMVMAWFFSYWIPLYVLIRSNQLIIFFVWFTSLLIFYLWNLPFNPAIDEEVFAVELGFGSFFLTFLVNIFCQFLKYHIKSKNIDDDTQSILL